MPSAMVSQTVQGAILSVTSNILAQAISAYREDRAFSLSLPPILKFALFSIISNPPNIVWQTFLEDMFPSNVPAEPVAPSEKQLKDKPVVTRTSKRNVLAKFALDQTIGAVVNTIMFLVFMAYANGSGNMSWSAVQVDVSARLWPMIMDGYKFWPVISLASFLWVPVDKRVVFGCSVGVLWGIYLSLSVA